MSNISRLDAWTIVQRTSQPEAHLALALDLREVALQDVEEIATCRSLRVALLSSNLLTQVGKGLFACRQLRKLDLARNGLTTLPLQDEWMQLGELTVLYLHDNQIQDVGALVAPGEGVLPALKELHLDKNNLDDAACSAIITALGKGAMPSLEDLNLTGNPASEAAREAVLAAGEGLAGWGLVA